MKKISFWFCLLFLLNSSTVVHSQKVGVVLSGGGAKGIAHVGVLKALEEYGIPIDYIAGTSIGAIVGGLYAIGYTPDEIEQLFKSDEFNLWASGKIDIEQTYFFKKTEDNSSWLELKFVDDTVIKPLLPTNLVSNNQMDFGFFKIFSQASAASNYNFDSLFVPFRCVATDVYSKKEFVMRNGELSSAIRASMTFPLYFKPIKINDVLLFDGGMVNNFPANVLINDFNPDVIIGSKVASNTLPPNEDDIYTQLNNMLAGKTDYSLPANGILIEPDVLETGLMDFYKYDELKNKGYKAAMLQMDKIKSLVYRRVDSSDVNRKRKIFTSKEKPIVFKDIYIQGLNSSQKEYVMKSILQNIDTFTISSFEKTYFKLIADEVIQSIYPRAIFNQSTNYFDLFLDFKRQKRFEANFGGNISSASLNQAYAGIKFRHLSEHSYNVWANIYFGRFYNSAQVKGRIDFPVIINKTRKLNMPFYVETGITINRWDFYKGSSDLFFDDSRPSYIIRDEGNITSNIGFPLNNDKRITTGISFAQMSDNYYQTNVFMKNDTADRTDFNLTSSNITLEGNTLNYKQYPNQGKYILISFRSIAGNELFYPGSESSGLERTKDFHNWFQFEILYDRYFRFSRNFTLGTLFQGLASTQDFFGNYTSTILVSPSFQPTPLSKTFFIEKYRAFNFAAAGLKFVFTNIKGFDFRLEAYLFQPYQAISSTDNKPHNEKILQPGNFLGTGILLYQTPAGPASLSINYFNKNGTKFYFQFNFGYIIFNKRGID